MSLIGKQIEEFSAQAYNAKTDEFIEVTHEDLKGNWNVVVFYLQISHSYVQLN